ncbi:MAG: hypothetical protein KBG02_11160 [Haliscomenobacter sp.]|nr:hypothetical protein [Haliscomenobacter sp.]MBP9077410.1 hypothetical protein [Haliscomenobacter sp.]MBP9873251.1 hypothetical protein [Haliscomenobacter sp.]
MSACTPCSKKRWRHLPWLPAVVVAILPKCPFCIMAYAGAVPLCGGKTIYPNAGNVSLYLTIGFAVVVLLGILLNHKGVRTFHAGLIAIAGVVCLVMSQIVWISMPLYYLGVGLLFFGIWYNGSFAYFKRTYFSLLANLKLRTKI